MWRPVQAGDAPPHLEPGRAPPSGLRVLGPGHSLLWSESDLPLGLGVLSADREPSARLSGRSLIKCRTNRLCGHVIRVGSLSPEVPVTSAQLSSGIHLHASETGVPCDPEMPSVEPSTDDPKATIPALRLPRPCRPSRGPPATSGGGTAAPRGAPLTQTCCRLESTHRARQRSAAVQGSAPWLELEASDEITIRSLHCPLSLV